MGAGRQANGSDQGRAMLAEPMELETWVQTVRCWNRATSQAWELNCFCATELQPQPLKCNWGTRAAMELVRLRTDAEPEGRRSQTEPKGWRIGAQWTARMSMVMSWRCLTYVEPVGQKGPVES